MEDAIPRCGQPAKDLVSGHINIRVTGRWTEKPMITFSDRKRRMEPWLSFMNEETLEESPSSLIQSGHRHDARKVRLIISENQIFYYLSFP